MIMSVIKQSELHGVSLASGHGFIREKNILVPSCPFLCVCEPLPIPLTPLDLIYGFSWNFVWKFHWGPTQVHTL